MGYPKLNKKGFTFQKGLYAIIIVGMIMTAVSIIITQWSEFYGSGINYDLQGYDKNDNISKMVGGYEGSISPTTSNPDEGSESLTFRAVFGIITNIFSPFRLVFGEGGMIDSIADRWKVPPWVTQGVVTMMVVAIIFAIVALIFRLQGGKV